MTTPRDLLITALDVTPDRPLERGDMALALAGAELIDLLTAQAVGLDGEHIVPGHRPETTDRLLDEAESSLVRRAPYETVEDWLWRRGRGLSAEYLADLESAGQLTRRPRRWRFFQSGQLVLADTPDRHSAAERRESDEPVLAALTEALGVRSERSGESATLDDAVATVLAAVNDALTELEAVRQRRAIEEAAFDNVWRGE